MSGFIGNAQPSFVTGLEDLRLNRMDFVAERLFVDVYAVASAPFSNGWWPRNDSLGASDTGIIAATWWGDIDQAAGASSRFGFTGVTRDALGTAVGSVTVKLFRTSDDTLLDTQTSDANGNFLLNTAYYPDAHYIVAHKSGSPDVDGVTVNTLIGS